AFDSNNQPEMDDRKPRGKGKRTLMLEAIRASIEGGEAEFLKEVVTIALGKNGGEDAKPNPQLLTLVLQRIEPPLKSTMPLIEFDFDEGAIPSKQAAQVMRAVSDGIIAPDVGQLFIGSIASMLKIEEVTELKDRLSEIEKALGISNE
ncbi:coil containing protein, partial [Vibrio phage 1.090.B._10N.286.48.F1]